MEWREQRLGGRRSSTVIPVTGTILNGEEFPCAFCKAAGVVAKTNSQCPVCRGHRSVKVNPPAVGCVYCKGRGEVQVRSGITCAVCRGKGVVPVREPIEACSACRGRGATGGGHLPCTTCRGAGVITTRR